jgi:hypothetical protein
MTNAFLTCIPRPLPEHDDLRILRSSVVMYDPLPMLKLAKRLCAIRLARLSQKQNEAVKIGQRKR